MSVRIDVVTTRGGDDGTTGLGDGVRVRKDDTRVEAMGALDEANAALGVLAACLLDGEARVFIARLQHMLFDFGADLCFPRPGAPGEQGMRVGDEVIVLIETAMAKLLAQQAPLTSFILPGGTLPAAQAHLARTVVRRAERRVVALMRVETVNPVVVRALNRMSDYLFVLARHLNADGHADILWEPRTAHRN